MSRRHTMLFLFTLGSSLLMLAASTSSALGQQSTSAQPPSTADTADSEPQTQPQLGPEMLALGDGILAALDTIRSQPVNTRDNTPGEILDWCLAFGCDAEVAYNGPSGKKINAIGCLCWTLPCAGYRLLRTGDGHPMARIGYGLQSQRSQFLAVLAQAAVPSDYEIRVGEFRATVADLADYEKRCCRAGANLSFAIIGLMHYLEDEPSWENDLGDDWSIERMIQEELDRVPTLAETDVTHCLMGLSYAVDRRIKAELPVEGQFLAAQQYLEKFQQYALDLQNSDGTWHPSFFTHKGTSRDVMGTLRSTAHVLRWLAFSLPEDRLSDPRLVRSVAYLAKLLKGPPSSWNVASTSPRDVDAVMHAVHALSIYHARVFSPTEPPTTPEGGTRPASYRTTPE